MITRVVEGFEFVLPVESAQGAELARVTLTHLAEKLGYVEKARLKDLANRHAAELSEFGDTTTVVVSVKCGLFDRNVEEPTFNVEQAAYLALSSETPVGRASRVAIIKAHKALLEAFRPAAVPVSLAGQLLAQAQFLVQIEAAQQEHDRRLAAIESDRARGEEEMRAVAELPPALVDVSERSNGQMVVALLNSYANAHGKAYQNTYRALYQAVEERSETRMDLRVRLANAKAKRQRGEKDPRLSDIIDASGKSAEIYAIARQLFASARRSA